MIPPSQLIGIEKFGSWYPGQQEIWEEMMSFFNSPKQFLAASIPTGFGKSLLAMMTSWFADRRTVYLTSTKGLQSQLMADFSSMGLVDIRGQNEYECLLWPKTRVDQAPCKSGYDCKSKPLCPYYHRLDEAQKSKFVVTNYAYWLAQSIYSNGLQPQDKDTELLILDEAHLAGRSLESFLQISFGRYDKPTIQWHEGWDFHEWRLNCNRLTTQLREEATRLANQIRRASDIPGHLVEEHRRVTALLRKCEALAHSRTDYVKEVHFWGQNEIVTWTPLWVKDHTNLLFQQVPKVILLSAILTPHIVENLGIADPQWIEAESPFPASNTPITHINTMRVDHRVTDEEMLTWVRRIDDIIRGRQDRKGLVFTVSYARAKLLRENSRYKDQIFVHDTKNVREVVDRFKAAPAPAVLVSPSVTTGWDFPQEECEYIIVGKVPYPDTRGALIRARMADNKDWAAQLAMETLVQETGRGTRSADDKCQVLVIDDAWRWWWPKYRHFAPKWFQERVSRQSVDLIPQMI